MIGKNKGASNVIKKAILRGIAWQRISIYIKKKMRIRMSI